MKIFIMTDMECVSGITTDAYLDSASPAYQITRRNLTRDINAVAAGCFEGGASEVHVQDGHGAPNNIVLDDLDPRVKLAQGNIEAWCWLDRSFDATMLVGQHAKAGTLHAFLEHTQSSKTVFDFSVNGVSLGETGQWALIAGHHNVPVTFLSGDDAACQEAQELLPGITTVSVGKAIGRQRLAAYHPEHVHARMREKAAEAVRSSAVKPYFLPGPYTVRLTLQRSDMADATCRLKPHKTRIDGRTVEMHVESLEEIMSIFV